ncbi:non-ribosomal peptide synthetase [Vibrio nigripulchritudo]|uniref:non-ribosomal peptide synthetase n=1 Tax=Vibrio nigripulchritudo TaxID=28173 RepID=UPI0003B1E968|nr:non-ribosomal peptide synthetase [Vibrio nigripulchritudo]CCN70369.1 hypothetical protein VIBNISFn118_200003 [Vibrio nigripulchritudo SFn118]
MSLEQLLDDLDAAAIQIWAEEGQLKFRAPPGALNEHLRARLIEMKPVLLQRLSDNDKGSDAERFEPFPQTPIQQAYMIGRTDALSHGGIAANSYIEFERTDLNIEFAEAALNQVIASHDMLRTVLLPDRQQKVLQDVPSYGIPVTDLIGHSPEQQEAELQRIRKALSEKVRDPEQWPLFDLHISRTEQGIRLHSCVDLIVLDAWSCQLFFQEWFQRIEGQEPSPAPQLRFRDLMVSQYASDKSNAIHYWKNALTTLPDAPNLPAPFKGRRNTGQFKRFHYHLPEKEWAAFQATCREHKLTPTSALATVFANSLSCWSANEDLTLNVTLFNRPPGDEDINRVLGEFTNTTLLSFDKMNLSFEAQVGRTQNQLLERLEHSDLSGVEIVRELARQRADYSKSLMPVVFTSLLIGEDGAPQKSLGWEQVYGISQTPQVTLDHQIYEEHGGINLNWDVAESAIDLDAAEEAFNHYRLQIDALANQPESWRQPLSRALPASQSTARNRIHAKNGVLPTGGLTDDFWLNLPKTAAQPAIFSPEGTLSYEQLACWAVSISEKLKACGVSQGDRVLIAMEKSPNQIAAVLAVLYLGGVYVPVSPDQPQARMHAICEQSAPKAVLCSASLELDTVPEIVVSPPSDDTSQPLENLVRQRCPLQAEQPAYIIFTSGSTGTPKGVCMQHGAVLNTLHDMQQRFGLQPSDRVFALSNLSFDLSVYDIFGTLNFGAALVLPAPDQERNPEHWADMMSQYDVSIWNSVPALLQMLIVWSRNANRKMPPSLRLALVSGDWVPMTQGAELKALSEAKLIALGGATEAAIWSNWQDVAEQTEDWLTVPYGQPLSGQYYRVLDTYGADRPNLVPGALYIGGLGLAREYWQDEEKTASSFILNPSREYPLERLYKTGDYGRFWQDVTLEFLGRRDQQVKIGGHRIELGEIIHALESHPDVSRAIAIVRDGTLLAYAVTAVSETSLQQHCARVLPNYMLPKRIGTLTKLPLSANGKVDTKALPALSAKSIKSAKSRSRKDSLVAKILKRKLGIKNLDPQMNFFELGLSSVDLVEAHGQLNAELPFDVPVTDLFTHTTVSALDAHIATLVEQHSLGQPA